MIVNSVTKYPRNEGQCDPKKTKELPLNVLTIKDWSSKKYLGSPPQAEWLVEGFIPMHGLTLMASAGGIGKGMIMLDIACQVAGIDTNAHHSTAPESWGKVSTHGSCVIFFAEDDKDEISRRLDKIDPFRFVINLLMRFISFPFPNAGHFPLMDGEKSTVVQSEYFKEICKQIKLIPDLKFIGFDPLASFVKTDLNASSENLVSH